MGRKPASGSGIRDSGWLDEHPDYIFQSLETIFLGLKYFNSFMRIRDPGWRQFGSGIRDGKKSDPGSGINIPDLQHRVEVAMLLNGPIKMYVTSNDFDRVSPVQCLGSSSGFAPDSVRSVDPGTLKWWTAKAPTKSKKTKFFHFEELDVLAEGLDSSPRAWTPFRKAQRRNKLHSDHIVLPYVWSSKSWSRIFGRNGDNSFKSLPPCYSQSSLQRIMPRTSTKLYRTFMNSALIWITKVWSGSGFAS